jgi:hypothetical protein
MRGSGWRREPVPAKTKTWGEVPSRRGYDADVGARTLEKTGMRRGVGEQSVGMEVFADGGRPYLRRRRRRRVGCAAAARAWARTLAKWTDFYPKPSECCFQRTVRGGLLTEARRPEAAPKSERLVAASASGGQKPTRI